MKFLGLLLTVASTVAAHGYVDYTFSAGKNWTSFLPFTDPYNMPDPRRIAREIPNDGPVQDFTSDDMTCNKDAQLDKWRTTSHAPINAGDQFTFHYNTWPASHDGPITVWMAACGDACTEFDATGNVWFKIDEMGLVSGTTDTGVWATGLLVKNNLQWTVTIPKTLKSGAYLLRIELLALHSAHAPQFYPSCQQIVLSGSGTDSPSASEMVAIPGYYKNDTSTNIDIWQNGQTSYPIAGPAVAKLAAYTGSDPVNSSGGLPLGQQLTSGSIVTSASSLSSSGSGSASSGGSGAGSGGGTVSTTATATASASASASSTFATTLSTAPAGTTSTPTQSCKATRKKRDLRRQAKDGAVRSKKHHAAKRRLSPSH